MSSPSRLPPEDYSDAQKAILDKVMGARGRIPVPLRIWLQSPTLAQAIEPLSTMLNTSSVLAKREWEIAVMIIARHWGSQPVLDAHARFMLAAGVPEALVGALKAGVEPPLETEREKAVYAIASRCDRREEVDDATFRHAENALGQDGMAELIAFIGYYSGIALGMKIYGDPKAAG